MILQSRIKLSRCHDSQQHLSAPCPLDRNSTDSNAHQLQMHVFHIKWLVATIKDFMRCATKKQFVIHSKTQAKILPWGCCKLCALSHFELITTNRRLLLVNGLLWRLKRSFPCDNYFLILKLQRGCHQNNKTSLSLTFLDANLFILEEVRLDSPLY